MDLAVQVVELNSQVSLWPDREIQADRAGAVGVRAWRPWDLSEAVDRPAIAADMRLLARRGGSVGRIFNQRDLNSVKVLIEAGRFERCGSDFAVFECEHDQHKYRLPVHCKSRICPICARIYSRELRRQLSQIAGRFMSQKRRGWLVGFVTCTIDRNRFRWEMPTHEELKTAGRQMADFIRLHYGKWKGVFSRNGRVVSTKKYRGAGAVAVMEFSEDGFLHFHALTYGPFIPENKLREDWRRITRDSYIVDIEAAFGNSGQVSNYLLKYISKPPPFVENFDLAVYAYITKGVRRLKQYGVMYNAIRLPKRKRDPMKCLYCGRDLRFIGVHEDPGRALIDYCTFKKYVDFRARLYLNDYGGALSTRDRDWVPE